ncbi:MAG: hypothetical protein HY979_00410 [Candidatus Magasanikbacteria bacterium]|nr:hypothetical protein [Candidatus Magasanikbacteria bacterium]
MLSNGEVKIIHQQLSQIFCDNLVLLGGSYMENTASVDSDLDIFLVCGWIFFLNRKKYQLLVTDLKNKYPQLQIMLVPKIFFKYGWYKVVGEDINGKKYSSPTNKKIIFRNAVKLAYFYLLKSITSNKKDYWKKQSDKQAAIAKEISAGEDKNELMSFSLSNYLIYNFKFIFRGNPQFLFSNPDKKIISKLKKMVEQNNVGNLAAMEKIVFPVIIW